MIRVLIVDDLRTHREFLNHLLSSAPDIEVVGIAENGAVGVNLAKQLRPDVITMDIHMPMMDGYQATRQIMASCATPIIILTASWDENDVHHSMLALEVGAVTALEKPYGFGHPLHEKSVSHLLDTIRIMSGVKVVTRPLKYSTPSFEKVSPPTARPSSTPVNARLVVVGVSTGGPPVLQKILSRFDEDFPASILIVQHISRGFLAGMRSWLQDTCRLPIHIPQTEETARPGNVYLAPDDMQMGIDSQYRITLKMDPPEHGLRPCAAYLFRHAAKFGRRAIGCLLTGMGKDGAEELALMRQNGAITFAQDEQSSVVFGMPGAAVELNGATYILPPEHIADKIRELTTAGKYA